MEMSPEQLAEEILQDFLRLGAYMQRNRHKMAKAVQHKMTLGELRESISAMDSLLEFINEEF